ncbi:acyl carrier protein [Escherichia coli]|nr:acyl carrier protein [Escherichia coli]
MTPDDIDTDAPLFGDGLGLDSIDAPGTGTGSKKMSTASCSLRKAKRCVSTFFSVATLASFIAAQRA